MADAIKWKQEIVVLSEDDRAAYFDARRIDSHFEFPHANVYSRGVGEDGFANVHQVKKKDRPRPHYLGNLLAIRHIKRRSPDAWIWSERFYFTPDLPRKVENREPQQQFLRRFGDERLEAVRQLAQKRGMRDGLTTTPVGLPDMAVYLPSSDSWQFCEVKRLGTRDKVRDNQGRWLELIADLFGDESAVELLLQEVS